MSAPAVLIANAKLRPGEDQAFSAWQVRHNSVLGKDHENLAHVLGSRPAAPRDATFDRRG
jgi:hypothetical protein